MSRTRDVLGQLSTKVKGKLLPGIKRALAPNFNRLWKREVLEEQIAAHLMAEAHKITDKVKRAAFEQEIEARARALAENYQAAHLWGPGFGDEFEAGMAWAPNEVNQRLQSALAHAGADQAGLHRAPYGVEHAQGDQRDRQCQHAA